MENPKIIWFLLFSIFFIHCNKKAQKELIRYNLYKDRDGIALKVKNLSQKHPSVSIHEDSIFLYEIYDYKNRKTVTLGSVIDSENFNSIGESKYYFSDSKNIYCYSFFPSPYQFFFIPKQDCKFLNKSYLKTETTIFYDGVILDKVNSRKFYPFYIQSQKIKNMLNFGSDTQNLYLGNILLEYDYLNSLDINKKQKDSLIDIYFR